MSTEVNLTQQEELEKRMSMARESADRDLALAIESLMNYLVKASDYQREFETPFPERITCPNYYFRNPVRVSLRTWGTYLPKVSMDLSPLIQEIRELP